MAESWEHMTQSNLLKNPQSLEVLLASDQIALTTPRRLIVLVPPTYGEDVNLTQQIWALAFELHLTVLFFGLCPDPVEEPGLRRRLVTMAASLQEEGVSAETRVELTGDWPGRLKLIYRPGDVIMCHAEQRTGMWSQPLSEVLTSKLKLPVYVLSGFYPQTSPLSRFVSALVFWGGSLAIIAGFFWVQVKLDQLPRDWAHNILLYLSVVTEAGVIWFWNSLFG
jgi:hypothetical protein